MHASNASGGQPWISGGREIHHHTVRGRVQMAPNIYFSLCALFCYLQDEQVSLHDECFTMLILAIKNGI